MIRDTTWYGNNPKDWPPRWQRGTQRIGICTNPEHHFWFAMEDGRSPTVRCPESGCDAAVSIYTLVGTFASSPTRESETP